MYETRQPQKMIFAASTGGHLAQLHRLAKRFEPSEESLWITFDSAQSRSLLAGRRTLFVPYIAPRDMCGVVRAALRVARQVDFTQYSLAVSTGAALALAVLPLARARRTPALYIESVSRFDGPSMTGRLLAASRLVALRTQHLSWADSRWRPIDPVLREFVAVPTAARPSPSIFVTLGTISPYRFDALLEGLETTGLPDSRTVWQVGCSGGRSLPGKQFESMPADEFEQHARAADLVVTHAGIGTILQLLEWGINPVVVPRRQSRGEHVDDHQLEVCRYLSGAGIGTVLDAAELTAERLLAATELHVQPASGSVLN